MALQDLGRVMGTGETPVSDAMTGTGASGASILKVRTPSMRGRPNRDLPPGGNDRNYSDTFWRHPASVMSDRDQRERSTGSALGRRSRSLPEDIRLLARRRIDVVALGGMTSRR